MRLNLKGMALAAAVVWGGSFFVVGVCNLLWPPYGAAFLDLGRSIYPGYQGPAGFGSVIVVALYALLDGAIGGLIFGWLYNAVVAGMGQRTD